jgi:hypothetical protein
MKNLNKPLLGATASLRPNSDKPTKPPFKIEVAAILLVKRCHQGVIQPEAHRVYGESCLHTSVSTLFNNYGIRFKRQPESITNRAGSVSNYTRYTLLDEVDLLRIKKLIDRYRARRGLPPFNWEVKDKAVKSNVVIG